MDYYKIKGAAIIFLDDLSPLYLYKEFGSTYSEKTLISSLKMHTVKFSAYVNNLNTFMGNKFGGEWRNASGSELSGCNNIGDFIKLVAEKLGYQM